MVLGGTDRLSCIVYLSSKFYSLGDPLFLGHSPSPAFSTNELFLAGGQNSALVLAYAYAKVRHRNRSTRCPPLRPRPLPWVQAGRGSRCRVIGPRLCDGRIP